ncbi:MAG: hypothetical protein GX442_08725 [Candidatus Riflebacteria bacterium]|nr:hypothetical protein [Candidatus Riflebacteria bacterium]
MTTGIVAVATIGNRDLQVDGKSADQWAKASPEGIAHPLGSCAAMGRTIQEDWAGYASRLSIPILDPFLTYVRGFVDHHQGKLTHLVLVVTNQPQSVEAAMRAKDTYSTGKVLEKWLRENRSLSGTNLTTLVVSANPTRPDDVAGSLAETLAIGKWGFLREADHVLLSITGGVPALNYALFLTLYFEVARDRLHCLHVNEATRQAVPNNYISRLQGVARRERIRALVDLYDFSAIQRELAPLRDTTWATLAAYGQQRLNFDFTAAAFSLSQALRTVPPAVRPTVEAWQGELTELVAEDTQPRNKSIALMRELLANMWIKLERGEWVDFLGRLYRLLEESLKVYVGDALGATLTFDRKTRNYPDYLAKAKARPQALEWFESQKATLGQGLRWEELNTFVGERWLEFFGGQGNPDESAKARRLQEVVARLRPLTELRNQSIMAHGFKPVSKEDLQAVPTYWSDTLALLDLHLPEGDSGLEASIAKGWKDLGNLILEGVKP